MAVASQQRMLEILVEAVDSLIDDFDLIDFLHRLTARCVELLDIDAVGVMIVNPYGELQVIAASDEHTRLLELFALQHEQGPCVECYRTGQLQLNINLESAQDTAAFGTFAERARGAGFRVTHAIPMRLRHQVIGALNLFHSRPGGITEPDVRLAQALADVATISILQQRTIEQGNVDKAQLQAALNSRVVIEQAKGVLAERCQIGLDEAFERMRGYARPRQLRLSELARQVVEGTLDTAVLAPG
ncbi:GAF and ANTAR domain-containing protein [Streptomyces hiroshimensis]|uniref:Transcriptional regulator n=1 Tax=Streptomyces hiroshimensis TaxID=66424 RepID=A0ABQ2Z9H2_9ACTN|nr:GAF and ANTAR domain-containing protein [Streptomyces hiroshimensis]GGY09378.1 transcriptional regulator [Streptomyces hiroshimensis]